ncbi:hypothetical protein [Rhizobium sp. Root482]|uniref:hypothetical protein n=1 Tax=Rhizobium sp. Root482 TaxID=1736543 RepID=UPI0006F224A5|nr:hypothetical protein [Rhizobium sp. Root482]KQY19682.1 hypothetical protein ASD31_04495 [Rhizobium sp. Root482]
MPTDAAPDTTQQPDIAAIEPWHTTFNQMWELFFRPEIERRRAFGRISGNFHLYIAQVLFPEKGDNRVLLNEEVKGEALVRPRREFQKGDPVYSDDLETVETFELPDELLDHGHFTIVRSGEGWAMIFNFMSGRAKARDMLELANQFLEVAKTSSILGHAGPTVDNLFSASELICKAELILHRSRAVSSKTHSTISSAINNWSRLGNINAAFVALFNELGRQRPNARYGDATSRPPMPDAESFELVSVMIERGLESVQKATDRARTREGIEENG